MVSLYVEIEHVQWIICEMTKVTIKKNYWDQSQQWSSRQVKSKKRQFHKYKMEEQLEWEEKETGVSLTIISLTYGSTGLTATSQEKNF